LGNETTSSRTGGRPELTDSDEATELRRRARRRLVGAIALVVLAVIVLPIIFDKEPKPVSQDIVIQIPSQNAGRFNSKVLPPPGVVKPDAEKPDTAPPGKTAEPSNDVSAAKSGDSVTPPPADASPGKAPEVKAEAVAKPAPVAKSATPDKNDGTKDAKAAAAKASAQAKAATAAKDSAKSPESSADSEAARAQAALQGDAYVVPLGAFLNQSNVRTLQAKVAQAGIKSYSEVQKVTKGEQIRVRAGPFPTREAAERAREQLQSTGLTVGPVVKL
jgi:DedD protein